MIARYRKKPVEIEAVQWTGENWQEIKDFAGSDVSFDGRLYVFTLEGTLKVDIGDYIIKGVKGEFYPCKPDVFERTYEPV